MTPSPSLCIVFDLDDTLYPEHAYVLSGFRAVGAWAASELGAESLGERCVALFSAGVRGDIFNRALAWTGHPHDPATVDRVVAIYRTHKPSIALFPDANLILDRLAGRFPIGLITDGHLTAQQAKVAALALEPRLTTIVYTDALGGRAFWKPSPAAFELIEQRIPTALRYVYVADNPAKDFIAPNARGWTTVRILREAEASAGEYHQALAPHGGVPRHTIATLVDLPAILGL